LRLENTVGAGAPSFDHAHHEIYAVEPDAVQGLLAGVMLAT